MKFPVGQITNPDVILVKNGEALTVRLTNDFTAGLFPGGTYARWTTPNDSIEAQLDKGDGRFAGFILFGNPDAGQTYTSYYQQAKLTNYATLMLGGQLYWTKQFETIGFDGRNSLGPATPLTYTAGQILYVSENGKLTNEDESDLTLFPSHTAYPNGDPMGINQVAGQCVVPASGSTQSYMLAQQF